MAKLQQNFKDFLQEINPDPKAVKHAKKAHEPIREFLEKDESFSKYFEGSFLYGSYPRQTAVGDIKDVDIVILTNFKPNENEPMDVLRLLKRSLAKHYKDPEMLEYQRRSIRVDEPVPDSKRELTLDIIPAVMTNGSEEPLLVPDKEVGQWIYSHPRGHMRRTTELNDKEYSGEMFVPLVKIMKWWWKYRCSIDQPKVERPKPKGFWIETLVGEVFDPSIDSYAEHFIYICKTISSQYKTATFVPELSDPGLPGKKIKTSMELDEFKKFIEIMEASLDLAEQAMSEVDQVAASKVWRKIFGNKFPLSSTSSSKSLGMRPMDRGLYTSDTEQFLSDYGIMYKGNLYPFKISARVEQSGFRPFILGLGSFIKKGCEITFKVEQNGAFVPHKILWKIKNNGDEAERLGQIRGQIIADDGSNGKVEHSKYSGKHYVECYVVDNNNVCIAMDRQDIHIP